MPTVWKHQQKLFDSTSISCVIDDSLFTFTTCSSPFVMTSFEFISSLDNGSEYDYVQTTAGGLPKSRTSATQTVATGHLYQVYGTCGDVV